MALGAESAAARAEIGALERLQEPGIPVHCEAGTSAEAIVGAAYAAERLSALRGLEFVRPHPSDRIGDLAVSAGRGPACWPRRRGSVALAGLRSALQPARTGGEPHPRLDEGRPGFTRACGD